MKFIHAGFSQFRILRQPFTWLKIFLLAVLLTIGISAWPAAKCALGQCEARNQWCNGDCSQECSAATQLGYVGSCSDNNLGGGVHTCTENWNPDTVAVRCSDPNNCNVTEVLETPNYLITSGGYSSWNSYKCGWVGSVCTKSDNIGLVNCCLAGSNGGTTCSPEYNPPVVALAAYSPDFPLVFGQDPDKVGVDVRLTATGGSKSNNCAEGAGQLTITSLSVNGVSLSDSSAAWITGVLALRYPGSYIKDSYPLEPEAVISGLITSAAAASFHFDPLDPGFYDISVTAIQSDGQVTTSVLNVPVYLLDSTISMPNP